MAAKNLTKISLKKEMLTRFLILSCRLMVAEEMSNSLVAVTGHTHRRVGQKAAVLWIFSKKKFCTTVLFVKFSTTGHTTGAIHLGDHECS